MKVRHVAYSTMALMMLGITGCQPGPWNNPYPPEIGHESVVYGSFAERPKHLDPARAYSSNEYAFIAQIYTPPLQYHFLKRPYQLVPLTVTEVPEPIGLDADGQPLPADALEAQIVYSEYHFHIQPGWRYQPHPALAKDAQGQPLYFNLSPAHIAAAHTLDDFPKTDTREVTAEDYVYQIKRLAFPRVHCPIAGVLGDYIVGFKDLSKELTAAEEQLKLRTGQEQPYLDLRPFHLAGVEVVDRYDFRIRLHGRYPQFLYWLAMPFFAPMPWEAAAFYDQQGMERHNLNLDWYPLGSGPFMLTENNPNLRMILTRNPYFNHETYPLDGDPEDQAAGLLKDAGRPLPFIDRAVYSLEKENIAYWTKFLQGFYDSSGISSDSFDQAVRFNDQGDVDLTDELQTRGIHLSTTVEPSIFYLGFNMLDPVVGGYSERARLLRQALSIALNFEEYIGIFLNGRGLAAQGPIPPGIFGYREGTAGINSTVYNEVNSFPQRKSFAQAQALLAQAGYPQGRDQNNHQPLVLYYDTAAAGPDDKAQLNWMRKQFEPLGIQLVIRATDYNRFQEKMRKGDAQLFMWGWNADYPDPENFLFLLYGPNGKVAHDGENAANYDHPEFNRLFERMKLLANGPERQAIIDRMLAIVRQDAPWAWGFHPQGFSLSHAWLSNLKPHQIANNTLKYRRLDPELRMRLRAVWNPPILWPLGVIAGVLFVAILPAYFILRRREQRSARVCE